MPVPAWAADPSCLLITPKAYESLPAEARRLIEVVDGSVMCHDAPSPQEQQVARNLMATLHAARPARPRLDVLPSADVRFRHRSRPGSRDEEHFTLRRPDISIVRRLDPAAKLWSDDVIVAIEVTSSVGIIDFHDKRAEYAGQRIPVYLIVLMEDERIVDIEEHRLDWSGRNYGLAAVHRKALDTELPEGMKLNVSFSELESG